MIADTLRSFEIGDIPVATPTGRLVGASGLLLESAGCRQRQAAVMEQVNAQLKGQAEPSAAPVPRTLQAVR